LWSAEATEPVRMRARVTATALLTVFPAGLANLPVSWSVTGEGVLEAEHPQLLRAPSSGFVTAVAVSEGELVSPGATVVQMASAPLALDLALARERLAAAVVRRDAFALGDPFRAAYHG